MENYRNEDLLETPTRKEDGNYSDNGELDEVLGIPVEEPRDLEKTKETKGMLLIVLPDFKDKKSLTGIQEEANRRVKATKSIDELLENGQISNEGAESMLQQLDNNEKTLKWTNAGGFVISIKAD